MTKYETYKKMTAFLDKLDKIYEEYVKDIEKEYLEAIMDDEDFFEKLENIEKNFDSWEEVKNTANEMCFEIVDKKDRDEKNF